MKVIQAKITSKEKGYYLVSFTVEKEGKRYRILAKYQPHKIYIDSSPIAISLREEQALAGSARMEKERYEQQI